MDIDAQASRAAGTAGGAPMAGATVSAAVPSSAAGGSAARSQGGDAGAEVNAANGNGSNAMQTDGGSHNPGSSTSAGANNSGGSTESSGASSKKYHGAFARYSAKHAPSLQNAASSGDQNKEKSTSSKTDVQPSPTFDIKTFLEPYSGVTVIDRLIYIGDRSSALSTRAYQMALDELRQTENTTTYRYLVERLAGNPSLNFDIQWMDAKNAQAAQQFERLELELSSYQVNLIKDNVRIAYREMGDFHFARGDYGAAVRTYSRMRDFCTLPSHHTEMNVCQARACLQLQSFSQLLTHVTRAEQQLDLDPSLANQLKCWVALAYLYDRKYKVAARRFLDVKLDKLPQNINQTITANDIAKYATLLALAEFDRNELKSKVLSNPDFALFLEKEPTMLELAKSFYESQYGKCMSILSKVVPDLRLDLRLGEHIDTLAKNIRARALIQYFTPFSSVDMVEMAKAFDMTVLSLEKELADLIVSGSISARIDSHNKRLHATESDQRSATFTKSYHAGDAFRSQAMAMLLRVNLIRNGFVVKGGKGQGLPAGLEFMDIPGGLAALGMALRGHKGR